MRAWLEGDLSGVEPRQQLDTLRETLQLAVREERSTARFWHALAELDRVATAELAVGPRALAERVAVQGCLEVVEALEDVVAASGLYARLVELAPSLGAPILTTAARRHVTGAWLARLSRSVEVVPGRIHLATARELGAYPAVADICARAGFAQALLESAAETRELHAAVALYRAGDREGAVRAAAVVLDADPSAPVLPWLAAVHGPDLDPLLVELAGVLQTDRARAALRLVASDFPATAAALG